MKVQFIRDVVRRKPQYRGKDGARAKKDFVRKVAIAYHNSEISKDEMEQLVFAEIYMRVPKGTVIDEPEAAKLVRLGMAEPVDEEARIVAGLTDAQMAAAQEASVRIERGQALPKSLEDQNLSDDEVKKRDATKDAKRKN